jgi:hypothetical protein
MNDDSKQIYDGVKEQLIKQAGTILNNPNAQKNFEAFLKGFEESLISSQEEDL